MNVGDFVAPIRFGIVGCGRIANRHFDAIARNSAAAELVAVCDTDPEALENARNTTGAIPYQTLGELLAASDLDVVVLATPSGLHAAQGIEVARSGRHVITEKPMATRWRDAQDLVRACDHAGVRLYVVKQNRCNPTLRILKNAIDSRRFGRIYAVACNVLWQRPQAYYDSAAWRGTWEFDGGALMNQASHYVDLLDWLVGPVESVHAFTATLARNIQVEDTGVVNIKWRSGTLGSMTVTMLSYPCNFEGSITILGECGTVRLGGVAVNEIQHWEFETEHPDDEKVRDANYMTDSVYGVGHPLYYDNVIRSLRGEVAAATDGREGLRSLELLIGIYLSARDGRVVSLPLEY